MRNPFTAAALGAALALSLAMPASAAEPQPAKEIAAAAQHAGFAAGSSDIVGIRTHLHHAVNCLVGPEGEGFAPKELNPCKALGNGAIPDTEDATRKESLEAALERAKAGLATDDLADAKTAAIKTQALLDSLE
ncbi:hypothetical protein [Parvibaculum sp.]|uniref:hypothetical protein n=1 Tax=Parvibaculum sp. TaxID=2024848 RepID=UPI002FDA7D00